jgi:hypothetical protein
MKVTLTPPERSLPTSVQYRSERIAAFSVDLDFTKDDGPEKVLAALRAWRDMQFQDLDAQETALRSRFAMDKPKPAPPPPEPATREQLSKLRELVSQFRAVAMRDPEVSKPATRDEAAAVIRGLNEQLEALRGGHRHG